ncbi:MAG: hypothetical protein ABSH51_10075 [Solirubrobacteraceae bacterium]|jgi:hypothetical protein
MIYLAVADLVQRYDDHEAPSRSDQLSRYELRCFSQHGEDGIIAEVLHRVGSINGYFVEFGIESGREGNCVFLADVCDWHGIFIEPDASAFAALARKYAGNPGVRTLRSAVTPENVLKLFSDHGVPREADVLSIDVDGADYWIWEAIDTQRYHPRVVVIEYNAALPVDARMVQPRDHPAGWNGTAYFGASLQALIELGERKGYRFVHTDMSGANAFFVRADLGAERFPSLPTAPRRGEPNYFMTGYHHPPDEAGHEYVDPGPR